MVGLCLVSSLTSSKKLNKGLVMKSDSKNSIVAKIDLHHVKYARPKELRIDFTNEIDLWSKMEFRYREQIKKLAKHHTLEGHNVLRDLNSLIYAVREKIE